MCLLPHKSPTPPHTTRQAAQSTGALQASLRRAGLTQASVLGLTLLTSGEGGEPTPPPQQQGAAASQESNGLLSGAKR